MPWLTTLRCTVRRIRHAPAPVLVDLHSDADGLLCLRVPTPEHDRALLAALAGPREVDVEMLRDDEGNGGEVQAVHVVEEGDAVAAWDAWYEASGYPWDNVDLERELRDDE